MRAGRPEDLAGVIKLWRADVRAGRRDSMPRQSALEGLAARFDWDARSRVVEDANGGLAGVVMLAAHQAPDGTLVQLDASATSDETMRDLLRWGLGLARASGAIATMISVGRGHSGPLEDVGLRFARPWWRMDRGLAEALPVPVPVPGYALVDGRTVSPGTWEEMHNRSFADHWRFSYRSAEELVGGTAPELCLMAVTGSGQPAALTLCQVERMDADSRQQPVGIVRSVGTLPAHRRRGLATWLVAEGLARLRAAGAKQASLYVDAMNETRAHDAYRNLGFEVAFQTEVWEATFR